MKRSVTDPVTIMSVSMIAFILMTISSSRGFNSLLVLQKQTLIPMQPVHGPSLINVHINDIHDFPGNDMLPTTKHTDFLRNCSNHAYEQLVLKQ